jgi:hypothetical protein
MGTQVKNIGSPLSPAVAVYKNMLYTAVRRPQNNEVNILRYDGVAWTEFGSAPGVRTPSQPALGTFEDKLYLAVRGEDNYVYLAAYDGARWFPPERAPGTGRTLAAPALAQFGSLFYLFYNSEMGYNTLWVAFNPNFKYGTYIVPEGQSNLRQVSAALYGGNAARYQELAAINHIQSLTGTDTYPVKPGDVLLTPPA